MIIKLELVLLVVTEKRKEQPATHEQFDSQ